MHRVRKKEATVFWAYTLFCEIQFYKSTRWYALTYKL